MLKSGMRSRISVKKNGMDGMGNFISLLPKNTGAPLAAVHIIFFHSNIVFALFSLRALGELAFFNYGAKLPCRRWNMRSFYSCLKQTLMV